MEVTWHWNFLETVAVLILFGAALVTVFWLIGVAWLWLKFRQR